MSFNSYAERTKEYITKLGSYLTGKTSAPNISTDIDTSTELNALHNVSSAEQLIQLSNAFYDQVAAKRCLKEIYKKPKDYLEEFNLSLKTSIDSLDSLNENVNTQLESVERNKVRSQSIRSISSRLQLKLSLIKDSTDA